MRIFFHIWVLMVALVSNLNAEESHGRGIRLPPVRVQSADAYKKQVGTEEDFRARLATMKTYLETTLKKEKEKEDKSEHYIKAMEADLLALKYIDRFDLSSAINHYLKLASLGEPHYGTMYTDEKGQPQDFNYYTFRRRYMLAELLGTKHSFDLMYSSNP